MGYRLRSGESVVEGVRRVAVEQVEAALGEVANPELDRGETVHQVRKRCKKLRGLLRLVRPVLGKTYAEENAWYRDAARPLSGVRDAESVIEAFDELLSWKKAQVDGSRAETVREALVTRRQRIAEQQTDLDERLAAFASRMGEGRARVESWSLDADGFKAIAGGLEETYRRGREAMRAAYDEGTPESFHEWRKRVKYGWYHHRLLVDVWKPVLDVRRELYSELSDLLGDDHDLVVLRQTLEADPPQFGGWENVDPLLGVIERRRRKLQEQAGKLGARLYAEKPKAFRKRMGALWEAGW